MSPNSPRKGKLTPEEKLTRKIDRNIRNEAYVRTVLERKVSNIVCAVTALIGTIILDASLMSEEKEGFPYCSGVLVAVVAFIMFRLSDLLSYSRASNTHAAKNHYKEFEQVFNDVRETLPKPIWQKVLTDMELKYKKYKPKDTQ